MWMGKSWFLLISRLMNACTLPTCGAIRRMNNTNISDVLYCTFIHLLHQDYARRNGDRILRHVIESMNREYAKYARFKPRTFIIGYSLGGIIGYDILCHQEGGKSHGDKHFDWDHPALAFEPSHLFSLGSPVGPSLNMRSMDFEGYQVPENCEYQNIFHLYDPLAYRFEPLMDTEYARVPPVPILLRKKRTLSVHLKYYRQMANSFFNEIATRMPLPQITFPSFANVSMPSLTLLFESVYSYTSPAYRHKRKRENDEIDDRVIQRQRVASEDDSISQEITPLATPSDRSTRTPVSRLNRSSEATAEDSSTGYMGYVGEVFSRVHRRLSSGHSSPERRYSPNPPKVRYDYFIDENVIDSNIHQYLVGMRAHFEYLTNPDVAFHIMKHIAEAGKNSLSDA